MSPVKKESTEKIMNLKCSKPIILSPSESIELIQPNLKYLSSYREAFYLKVSENSLFKGLSGR